MGDDFTATRHRCRLSLQRNLYPRLFFLTTQPQIKGGSFSHDRLCYLFIHIVLELWKCRKDVCILSDVMELDGSFARAFTEVQRPSSLALHKKKPQNATFRLSSESDLTFTAHPGPLYLGAPP